MKKMWKKATAFLLSAGMIVSMASCSGTDKKDTTAADTKAADTKAAGSEAGSAAAGDSKGTIKFGIVTPITGTHAEYGIGCEAAVKIAIDEINEAGGVNGYMLDYEVKDSKSESKESADIVRQYAEDDSIYAIIGDFTSGCCMADAPIVDEAGIVLLSPTASNPDYPGMSDYCFTVMNNQASEAPWFGKALVGKYLGAKKVAVMSLNTDWGVATHDYLLQGLQEANVEVTADEVYAENETDFSSVISKLKASNPEAVVILDQGNVPTIINQIRGTGWDVQICSLGPGCSEQLLDLCGENAEGFVVDTPSFLTEDSDNAAIADLCKKFKEATGYAITDHSLCAYNTVQMLKLAIESLGDKEITREAIKDALKTTEYDGLAGHIQFTENGGCNRQVLISKVVDGKYEIVCDYGYGTEE